MDIFDYKRYVTISSNRILSSQHYLPLCIVLTVIKMKFTSIYSPVQVAFVNSRLPEKFEE